MNRSSYRGQHKGSTAKARGKIAFDRTFSIILVFVLVIGLMPGLSFAGDVADVVQPLPVDDVMADDGNTRSDVIVESPSETDDADEQVESEEAAEEDQTTLEQQVESEDDDQQGSGSTLLAMAVADDISITPSVGTDVGSYNDGATYYANGAVTVAIKVDNLETGDVVKVSGGSAAVEDHTVGADETVYETTIGIADVEGDSTVEVQVVPNGGGSPVTKQQKITVDKTAPSAPEVSVAPAASDTSNTSTIYFNLNGANLVIGATFANEALFDDVRSIFTANGTEIKTWTTEGTNTYKAEATITAAQLVNEAHNEAKNATIAVEAFDKLGNSKTYVLVYDGTQFKFVEQTGSVTPVDLTSESGLLPTDAADIITLEGSRADIAPAGLYNDDVKVTAKGNTNYTIQNTSKVSDGTTDTPLVADGTSGDYAATITAPEHPTAYTVTVDVRTTHGATASYTSNFTIDAEHPTLDVSWTPADTAVTKGEINYFGSARTATITIEDEGGLYADDIAAVARAKHTGGTFAVDETNSTKNTEGLYTKYIATVAYDTTTTGDDCALVIPNVRDAAGNDLVEKTGSDSTYGSFAEDTHTYTAKSFRILLTPVLTVKSVTPERETVKFPEGDGGKLYYKTSLSVVWTVQALSQTDADAISASVALSVPEGGRDLGSWQAVSDSISFERTVKIENTNGEAADAITMSSASDFLPPAETDQTKPGSTLVKSYTFIPKNFTVDNVTPKLKVSWAKASGTPEVIETVKNEGTADEVRWYGGGTPGDAVTTATLELYEVNPLDTGEIIVDFGDGTTADLSTQTPDGDRYTLAHEYKGNGEYAIKVSGSGDDGAARDLVGNKMEAVSSDTAVVGGVYTAKVIVDQKAPDVQVSYFTDYDAEAGTGTPLAPNADGKYYANEKVTAKVVVDDVHFDAEATTVTCDGTDVKKDGNTWNDGEGDAHVALFEFDADADTSKAYSLSLTAKDEAGNETPYPTTGADSVIIDKVAPKLIVAPSTQKDDQNRAAEGEILYYDAAATLTVKIIDDYVDLDNGVTVTASEPSAVGTWNASTKELVVTFAAPADDEDILYTLSVIGTDKAGNPLVSGDEDTTLVKDGAYATTVVIDKLAPKLTVTWDNVDVRNGEYYNATRTPEIKVEEKYFDPAKIKVDGVATTAEDWSDTGYVHVYQHPKTYEDGTYTLAIEGTDWAHNDLAGGDNAVPPRTAVNGAYNSGEFIVDTVFPVVTFKMSQARSGQFGATDFYRSGDQIVVTVRVEEDHFAPINNSFDTVLTPGGTNTAAYAKTSWNGHEYQFTFTPNDASGAPESNTLSAKVYDLAGNLTELNYGAIVTKQDKVNHTVDPSGAEISGGTRFALDITAPALAPGNGVNVPSQGYSRNYGDTLIFYRSATSLAIVVNDALGIRKVDGSGSNYTFDTSTGGEGDKTWTVGVSLRNGVEFTEAFTLEATDLAGNVRRWKIHPKELAVEDVVGSNPVNLPIYDSQRDLYPTSLILDTTPPVVELAGATPGQYYNTTQTVTTTVRELNFGYLQRYDGGQIVTTMTKQEGNAGRATSTRTASAGQFGGSGSTFTFPMDLADDGHYSFAAHVTDPAGNEGSATLAEFTVDKTAPVATISWNNSNARNGMYYNAARTATITIVEHNFLASDFTITTTGAIGGWSSNGDTHTCTVSYTTDGRYTLTVSGHDRAGNAMNTITEPEFVIDLIAPTIDFSDVVAQTAYNDVIAPHINYHDEANFDSNGMSYTLTGAKHGPQQLAAGQSSSGNDGTVAFDDFTREVEYDDIYTLQANLTDLAGNTAENSIVFSVNRFGSNFIVEDADVYSENNGYLAEPREIQVREINVSGSLTEQHSVSVTHGLSTENLTRRSSGTPSSDGFYIVSGADSAGWSSYVYHIGSGNFSDDGNYHVVISSTDAATNLNNSASYYDPDTHNVADAEVSFILDTADPIIDGINVSNGGTLNANDNRVSFTVTDNIGFDSVNVTVDGQTQKVEPEMGGLCVVDIPAKTFTARDMNIVATDMAGRSARASVNGFHYTSDFLELNLPLVIGGVAIVVIAAAALGVFFVRRRRS